jgi:hypothetical protein
MAIATIYICDRKKCQKTVSDAAVSALHIDIIDQAAGTQAPTIITDFILCPDCKKELDDLLTAE